jgi:hypothetical protein
MDKFTLAFLVLAGSCSPLFAQSYGRLQVNPRVDGRGSHNQGFPPSAADMGNRFFDNPVSLSDCVEVDAFAPNARPGWQERVRFACQWGW